MVWARLDDEILDNPKVLQVGVLGFALHVAAITWSCRNLTDGFIPHAKVRLVIDMSDVPGDEPDPLVVAEKLVETKLWDRATGGFQIHDFLVYNPSREKVLAERQAGHEAKVQAGRLGGLRSAEVRRSKGASRLEAAHQAEPKQTGSPVPGPVPGDLSASAREVDLNSEACSRETEPPTPVPSASETRRGGTFGLAADAWADGVRSVTGARPALAPWDRSNLEDLARDAPPELEQCAHLRADGVRFAQRQRTAGMLVSAKAYCAWVASGRPEPPPRAGQRPELARGGAPVHTVGELAPDWANDPAPTADELVTGAGDVLAALGGVK